MKLRTTVFLWVLALVAVILGATLAAVYVVLDRGARRQVTEEVAQARASTLRVHALQQTLEGSQCRVVAEEPRLKAVTDAEEISHETVIDVAQTLAGELHGSVLVMVDAKGALLADVADPDAAGPSLAGNPVVAHALSEGEAPGIWVDDRGPHQVQGCRLEFGKKVVGALVIGHALDAAAVEEIAAQTGSPVAVVMGDHVVATSSFDGEDAAPTDLAAAARALPGEGQAEVEVNGTSYLVNAAPVPGSRDDQRLRYLMFRSLDHALAPRRRLMQILAAVVAAGLLGALLLALGLAQRLAGPIVALVKRTRAIAEGDLGAKPASGPTEVRALGSAMNQMASELDASRQRMADRERLSKELEIATRIQTSILPKQISIPGLEVAAHMQPADEVGGDYYDALPTAGGGAWFAIGDVAGHGLNAGLVMMMVQTAVATLVRESPDAKPSQHLAALNDVIFENVRNRMGSDRHVTLSLLRYAPGGQLDVAGAHLDMTVWRAATSKCELVATQGTWISLTENIARSTRDERHQLSPGDVLVLCTDGITEAMDDAGTQFGFERIIEVVEGNAKAPVDAIRDAILGAARGFCRVQHDDMTLLVIRYRGRGGMTRFMQQVRIGQEALERGSLDPARFADAMRVIADACAKLPGTGELNRAALRGLWVDAGFLNAKQFDDALSGVASDDTLHAPPTPVTSAAAARSSEPTVHLVAAPASARVPPARAEIAVVIAPESTAPLLAGRYRRLGVLGEGGLGEVLACLDQSLGRTVAVKATRPDHSRPADAHLILEREAAIIASLEHPNIVPVYDAGRDSSRGPFYVMRQLTQPSLEHVLTRLRTRDPDAVREYTLGRLLRYFWQVCRALDYAHSRGVVHCDLKPANVLLGEFGEVLVVDWGLAQIKEQRVRVRGGTPGYMAPEQYDPAIIHFDARTDVFALGAILYEVITLRRAFASDEPDAEPQPPSEGLVPPRMRVPELEIPVEVEDICLRALALEPDQRMPSAGALADAVEEFLEGTKERERRRAEANLRVEAGDELAERYLEFAESAPEHHSHLAELRAEIAPWESLERKRDLWDAEDMAAVTDALRVRTLQSAVSSYEQALDAMPGHPGARRGLARLFFAELKRARQARDPLDQIYFENLVRQHDADGSYAHMLSSPGLLLLELHGQAAEVSLAQLREVQRRLVERQGEILTQRPLIDRPLAPGRYIVRVTAVGGGVVRCPLLVQAGTQCRLSLDLTVLPLLEPDEVLIPGGPALLGGDPHALDAGEPREVTVASFAIQRRPVTFRRYLTFVSARLAAGDPDAPSYVPETSLGLRLFRADAGSWAPEHVSGLAAPGSDPFELPVVGVSPLAARAYAAWLSASTGRSYRLPGEDEWEKAGRGADGRFFPWGDRFDATYCGIRVSRPGAPVLERSGSFATDVSPFGVEDLAGGVADWVAPRDGSAQVAVSRGGAWADWEIDCRLASRRAYGAGERAARVGFRLVRDVR